MGINGHSFQFIPDLYDDVATHARAYHPVYWDVKYDICEPLQLPLTLEKITKDGQINWIDTYCYWANYNFTIDLSLEIDYLSTHDLDLDQLETCIYNYTDSLLYHLSPVISSVEIGNEIVKTDPTNYLKVFKPMACAVRNSYPGIKIVTPAVAVSPDGFELPIGLFSDYSELYDVINIHTYAFISGYPEWQRTNPEDVQSNYLNKIYNIIKWRNKNAPGKEIWITEFGFDAPSKVALARERAEEMQELKVSSELEQAQWLVRSHLLFSAMDVERAYIYYFNDSDVVSLHGASGITRNFIPKPAYFALKQLKEELEGYQFNRRIKKERNEIYIYEYIKNQEGRINRKWVAWRPINKNNSRGYAIKSLYGEPVHINKMKTSPTQNCIPWKFEDDTIKLPIDGSPLFILF